MTTNWNEQDYQDPSQQLFDFSKCIQPRIQQYPQSLTRCILGDNFMPELHCQYQPYPALPLVYLECDKAADYGSLQADSQYVAHLNQRLPSATSAVSPSQNPVQARSTGRALCIGVNYFNQKGAMRGRTAEARSFCAYLQQVKHYRPECVVLLTDDQNGPFGQPTKLNILNALTWLGQHAFQGEEIIIYYSGHGQVPVFRNERTRDPQWKHDSIEAIYPVNFRDFKEGAINPEELEKLLEPMKRRGAKLTLILDTHAGIVGKKQMRSPPQ